MNRKHQSGRPALNHRIGVHGYNFDAGMESFVSNEQGHYDDHINTLQEYKNSGKGERTESDTRRIDFFKECYGNHSSTSVVCPFCALGLDCEQTANNKRLREQVNSLASQEEI